MKVNVCGCTDTLWNYSCLLVWLVEQRSVVGWFDRPIHACFIVNSNNLSASWQTQRFEKLLGNTTEPLASYVCNNKYYLCNVALMYIFLEKSPTLRPHLLCHVVFDIIHKRDTTKIGMTRHDLCPRLTPATTSHYVFLLRQRTTKGHFVRHSHNSSTSKMTVVAFTSWTCWLISFFSPKHHEWVKGTYLARQ